MNLKKGCKGEEVKQLQVALNIEPADGDFGPKTDAAVRKFQKENGLTVDGIVGPKTMKLILAMNLDSDSAAVKAAATSTFKIDSTCLLPSAEYLHDKKYKNEYIVLHHTAGHDNPFNVIKDWAKDTRGRVCTEFVIGGQESANGRSTYDGIIARAFPEGGQGGHIGKSGSSYMNLHAVGIEMCNMGYVKNGKTYCGSTVIPSQIVTLNEAYKGYKEWHRYSDAQLKAAHDLLLYIANRDNIDLHKGIYEWIKKEGVKAFDFHEDAYYGKVKGLVTHANIRKDKYDCFPQQELIDMILSL